MNTNTNTNTNTKTKTLMLIAVLSSMTFGNFRIITLKGGNLKTIKSTSAILKREYVKITLFRDSCYVNCTFFVQADKDEDLVLAFPNKLIDFNIFRDTMSQGVENFKVKVNDKIAKYAEWNDSSKSFGRFHDNIWFRFTAPIEKGKLNKIECNYKDTWHTSYTYLIGTGITWPNGINSGKIVFDHSKICSDKFVYTSKYFKNNPDPDIPQKLIPTTYTDSIVYEFSDYIPDSSEVVSIRIFPFWTDSIDFNRFQSDAFLHDPIHGPLYGWENSFLFRFLADTINFNHAYDFANVRNEIIKRTSKSQSLLSAGEKSALSILSGNLDSLRNRIVRGAKSTGKAILVKAKSSENGERKLMIEEIKDRVDRLNRTFDLIAPVYMNEIAGQIQVSLETDSTGHIKDYKYESNLQSEEGLKTILEILSITKEPTLYTIKKMNAKLEFELEIKIE